MSTFYHTYRLFLYPDLSKNSCFLFIFILHCPYAQINSLLRLIFSLFFLNNLLIDFQSFMDRWLLLFSYRCLLLWYRLFFRFSCFFRIACFSTPVTAVTLLSFLSATCCSRRSCTPFSSRLQKLCKYGST